jgi:anti-sigma B factor antagonist
LEKGAKISKISIGAAKIGLNDRICNNKGVLTGMDEKAGVEILTQENAGIVVFKSASITDADSIASISRQITDFINQKQPNRLIFDFENVKFFSSQVLGMLLDVRARVDAYHGQVIITAINPQLHRVFRITNLDKIFMFFQDRKSAIQTIN